MNGEAWMEKMLGSKAARAHIPMELQATLPLPVEGAARTAQCWYYRLELGQDGPRVSSPALSVRWNVDTMEIVSQERLSPQPLGLALDVLGREHREREDAYLGGAFTAYLSGGQTDWERLRAQWLEAAPQAMRPWLAQRQK